MYFLTHLFTPLCLYNDISLMNSPILNLAADPFLFLQPRVSNIKQVVFNPVPSLNPSSFQSFFFPAKASALSGFPSFWDCKGRKLFLITKKYFKIFFPPHLTRFNPFLALLFNLITLTLPSPPYLRKRSAKVEKLSLNQNINPNIYNHKNINT